jgi:hypothetical protein
VCVDHQLDSEASDDSLCRMVLPPSPRRIRSSRQAIRCARHDPKFFRPRETVIKSKSPLARGRL